MTTVFDRAAQAVEERNAQEAIRLDAWRAVFQKANRILSGQRVHVHLVDALGERTPAWSDGLDIFLNLNRVKEMLSSSDRMSAVLRLKGLNYHELCHVLYTPRMTDELPRRIMKRMEEQNDKTWWYAFNALEDQRIETWFASTYGASRRYFEATVLEWIIKNGSAEAAVLIYGRKYLSPKIRVKAGKVFVKRYGEDLYHEFQTVIDEYLTLVLPRDSIKAMSLLMTYHDLLQKMQQMGGTLPILIMDDNGGATGPQTHNDQKVARKGRVLIKPASSAAKKADKVIEDAIDADAAEAAKGGGAGSPQKSSGEGGESGDGDDDASSDAGAGQGESPDSGQQADQATQGKGASSSGTANHKVAKDDGKNAPVGHDDVRDAMEEFRDGAYEGMDDVREDDAVVEDVGRVLDAVNAAVENGRMNAEGVAKSTATFPPNTETKMATRRVQDVLARIRQDAEPETLWREQNGRLDGRRFVQRRPHETDVFKRWDHGHEEETGVESVILVDVSGSMGNSLVDAANAVWALKRAFDRLDIRTTVLMYDTKFSVVYQPGEKAQPNAVPRLGSGGGTNPTGALRQASRILYKSQAPNKVLITVTDGAWGGDEDERKSIMRTMNSHGVTTMLLGLDRACSQHGAHHHAEGHDLRSIRELPKAAIKLVSRIMRSAALA